MRHDTSTKIAFLHKLVNLCMDSFYDNCSTKRARLTSRIGLREGKETLEVPRPRNTSFGQL